MGVTLKSNGAAHWPLRGTAHAPIADRVLWSFRIRSSNFFTTLVQVAASGRANFLLVILRLNNRDLDSSSSRNVMRSLVMRAKSSLSSLSSSSGISTIGGGGGCRSAGSRVQTTNGTSRKGTSRSALTHALPRGEATTLRELHSMADAQDTDGIRKEHQELLDGICLHTTHELWEHQCYLVFKCMHCMTFLARQTFVHK